MKVWNTIRTCNYNHMANGSVLKLINNFNNMYKDEARYNELMQDYNNKLNSINK
jgi:hypothetical protein